MEAKMRSRGRPRVPRVTDFNLSPGDRVEVRCTDPTPAYAFDWRPGTVIRTHNSYVTVRLDEPVTLAMGKSETTFKTWSVNSKALVRRSSAAKAGKAVE